MIHESRLISLQLRTFWSKISMKLFYQHMTQLTIFFNFSPTSGHLHPLQGENCDSNSRLVVDEDDHGKFRLERVKKSNFIRFLTIASQGSILDVRLWQIMTSKVDPHAVKIFIMAADP